MSDNTPKEFFDDIKQAQKIVENVVDKNRDELVQGFASIILKLEGEIKTQLMSQLTDYKLAKQRKK